MTGLTFFPVCTLDRFAELSGLSRGVVDGWVKRGYLPVVRVGTRTLVNLAVYAQTLLEKEGVRA